MLILYITAFQYSSFSCTGSTTLIGMDIMIPYYGNCSLSPRGGSGRKTFPALTRWSTANRWRRRTHSNLLVADAAIINKSRKIVETASAGLTWDEEPRSIAFGLSDTRVTSTFLLFRGGASCSARLPRSQEESLFLPSRWRRCQFLLSFSLPASWCCA